MVEGSQLQEENWESARGSRGSTGTQGSPVNSPKRSEGDALKYAAAGATAGIGASLFARDHEPSPDSKTGMPAFEHPREPPSTPFNASQSASSKSDRRFEPSPKTVPIRRSEEATVRPGDYKTLPSGTASGLKMVPTTSSHGESRGEQYNHLGSGTASGVKSDSVGPTRQQTAGTTGAASYTKDSNEEEYNVLPSGTPSGGED